MKKAKVFTLLTDPLIKVRVVGIQYKGKKYEIVTYQMVRKIFSYRQQ